ncbi:MAG TPA: class I SAM-dependent methyltransferase [Terracidiphilus sp.]|nr:class I SAM-dependent methyltransferase [Terracidiphilus sp.]
MTILAMPKVHGDRAIEGVMAKWYAANTGEMMHEYEELAERVRGELREGSEVLEVAPGPGYFCIELAKRGRYAITGLDISHTFVKMAAEKAREAGVKVEFRQGSASKMPLASESFDFLLCRAAFKNFADPVGALREMRRVLKPGGQGVLIDLRRDATQQGIEGYVNGLKLSRVNRWMTMAVFKKFLVKSAYTRVEFERMLAQAGWDRVEIAEEEIGLEVRMEK